MPRHPKRTRTRRTIPIPLSARARRACRENGYRNGDRTWKGGRGKPIDGVKRFYLRRLAKKTPGLKGWLRLVRKELPPDVVRPIELCLALQQTVAEIAAEGVCIEQNGVTVPHPSILCALRLWKALRVGERIRERREALSQETPSFDRRVERLRELRESLPPPRRLSPSGGA
jgi:hypothetical protein